MLGVGTVIIFDLDLLSVICGLWLLLCLFVCIDVVCWVVGFEFGLLLLLFAGCLVVCVEFCLVLFMY